MRLLSYDGIQVKLTEDEWEQIMSRFDAGRASLNAFGYMTIHVSFICADRQQKCIHCSWCHPHKRINGCTYLFQRLMGEEYSPYVYLFDHAVMWSPEFDAEARQALENVRGVLSTARQI